MMTGCIQLIISVCVACVFCSIFTNAQRLGKKEGQSVCTSPACQKLANYYLQNMDKYGNPCVDFYDFVCRGWPALNPPPNRKELWKVERVMEKNVYGVLQKALEAPIPAATMYDKQVRELYRVCMNLPHMEPTNSNILKGIVRKVGHWPMFLGKRGILPLEVPWWRINNEYIRISGESALFGVRLVANVKKNNHITLLVQELFSPYGTIKRFKKWSIFEREKKHYKVFLKKLVYLVAPEDPTPHNLVIEADINDVINFRERLRQMTENLKSKVFEVRPLREVDHWYNAIAPKLKTSKMNWLEVLKATHGGNKDPYGVLLQATTPIEMQLNYFVELAKLLGATPERVIVNHIHLYFVEKHIYLTPDLLAEVRKSYNDLTLYPTGKLRQPVPKLEWCIRGHNMNVAITSMYVKAAFPEVTELRINYLIGEAKQALRKEFLNARWIDEETKQKAAEKITYLSSSVGYPKWLTSKSEKVDNDDINPLEPNMYYVPLKNRLYISASYLQPPIYTPNVPYVVDYGATVSAIGHELYHAFGTHSLTYNEDGTDTNYLKKMRPGYEKRADCFRDQYHKFRHTELKKLNLTKVGDLPSTLEEDIADVMGLKLAYKVYQEKLAKNKGDCQILPGFEKFGCDQLFFIAFANPFCSSLTFKEKMITVLIDDHSLDNIRVNGAVANMKEFSTAFGCKPNDPLNLEKRCDIWHH